MGLLDFATKVLTEYKADISDHKAKIKDLTGAQKELAKQELAASEARNKQIEDQIKGLAKVGAAIGSAVAAVKIGQAGFEEWSKYQTLASKVSTDTLDKLKEASGGLRTEMDLLAFSAKAQHGVIKVSTEQQELALQAMRALENQGYDSADVFDKVTASITKLNTGGLADFGISVDAGKTKAETFKNIMAALSDEVKKAGGSLESEGDDVKRLGVQWDDAMSKIKRAIGEIVVALGPLLSLVGDIAGAVGDVVGGLSSVVSYLLKPIELPGTVSLGTIIAKEMLRVQTAQAMSNDAISSEAAYQAGSRTEAFETDPRVAARYAQASNVRWAKITAALKKASDEAYGRAVKVAQRDTATAYRLGKSLGSDGLGFAGEDLSLGGMVDTAGLSAFGDSAFGETIGFQDLINARGAELSKATADSSALDAEKRQKRLESIFGPVSDFQAYAAGFQLLSESVSAAFHAWQSGAEGAATAIRKALGSVMHAHAVDAFGQAAKHAAYALGSLAFGDVRGASTHGAAAAKFLATAAVLGGLSAALGGGGAGGSGASTGAAAPVGSASTGASSGSSSRPITVILGDETGEESPRRRQNRAAAALERARRVTSADDGVIYG